MRRIALLLAILAGLLVGGGVAFAQSPTPTPTPTPVVTTTPKPTPTICESKTATAVALQADVNTANLALDKLTADVAAAVGAVKLDLQAKLAAQVDLLNGLKAKLAAALDDQDKNCAAGATTKPVPLPVPTTRAPLPNFPSNGSNGQVLVIPNGSVPTGDGSLR